MTMVHGPLKKLTSAALEAELEEFLTKPEDPSPWLEWLVDIGYDKRTLLYLLDIEPMTLERWFDGRAKSMRTENSAAFTRLLRESIYEGRSQRPIAASDTGFVSWRSLLTKQGHADRIWYFSSEEFLLSTAYAVRNVVTNLFLRELQDSEKRSAPVLIYVYPQDTVLEASLRRWTRELQELGSAVRGTIIGIKDYRGNVVCLPGERALLLETVIDQQKRDAIRLEGYVCIDLPTDIATNLATALDPQEGSPNTPWLTVSQKTAESWYVRCQIHYDQKVRQILDEGCVDDLRVREIETGLEKHDRPI